MCFKVVRVYLDSKWIISIWLSWVLINDIKADPLPNLGVRFIWLYRECLFIWSRNPFKHNEANNIYMIGLSIDKWCQSRSPTLIWRFVSFGFIRGICLFDPTMRLGTMKTLCLQRGCLLHLIRVFVRLTSQTLYAQ